MPTGSSRSFERGSIWLGLLCLYVVWGSTYLGIAVAVETIPPFLMGTIRFATAGAILLAWSIAREGTAFVWPSRREWRDSLIVGGALLGGGMGLVAWGEQTIASGIAALLVAMMPVWVAVIGRAFTGERLPRLAIVGIIVGFVGVALLVSPTILGDPGALEPFGLLALLLAPISWAAGSLFATNRATLPRRPLVATGLQMICGSVVLTVMAIANGEPGRFDPGAISGDSALALAYLTIIGSLLAFTVYGWMLRVAPLPLIATYGYVNPVVAVILGGVFLHESIEPPTLVAGAIIVVAVALIVTARGRMRAPTRTRHAEERQPAGPQAGRAVSTERAS